MSPRELLQDALRRRGRVWGDRNGDAIKQMHAEVSHLHRRPRLGAVIMSRFFGGKALIAYGDGCYLSCRVSPSRTHSRGN